MWFFRATKICLHVPYLYLSAQYTFSPLSIVTLAREYLCVGLSLVRVDTLHWSIQITTGTILVNNVQWYHPRMVTASLCRKQMRLCYKYEKSQQIVGCKFLLHLNERQFFLSLTTDLFLKSFLVESEVWLLGSHNLIAGCIFHYFILVYACEAWWI